MNTVAELIAALQKLPQDLAPFVTIAPGALTITNGEVQKAQVVSAAVGPADFGQLVVITGGLA